MQETVFIGVGSNLNSPIEQVESAFVALSKLANTRLLKQSSLYQSAPMGPQDQDDYINAVAAIKTDLAPLELLDELQEIESQHGRIRKAQQGVLVH
jgi:2-amino-4-hydroxy-6-hydroxymethyldihydropteridine diphosphokinase